MKYLKKLGNWISSSKIDPICKKYKITNYTIGKGGVVNVDGDVDLSRKGLKEIPLNFGEVTGNFNCGNNPKENMFPGPYNSLKNLKGSPKIVGGDFTCDRMDHSSNDKFSLIGGPSIIKGSFDCDFSGLESLEYGPQKVGKNYVVCYNKLTSLKGCPDQVENLWCNNNQITSLEYIPQVTGTLINIRYNKIFSLKEIPTKYMSIDFLDGNPICDLYRQFLAKGKISFKSFIEEMNEFTPIKSNIIDWERMSEVYYSLDITPPKEAPKKFVEIGYEISYK